VIFARPITPAPRHYPSVVMMDMLPADEGASLPEKL